MLTQEETATLQSNEIQCTVPGVLTVERRPPRALERVSQNGALTLKRSSPCRRTHGRSLMQRRVDIERMFRRSRARPETPILVHFQCESLFLVLPWACNVNSIRHWGGNRPLSLPKVFIDI